MLSKHPIHARFECDAVKTRINKASQACLLFKSKVVIHQIQLIERFRSARTAIPIMPLR